jgi:hypothetical protein
MDRRTFLATSGLALAGLATACAKKPKAPTIPAGATIDQAKAALAKGDTTMQVIQAVRDVFVQRSARVPFALISMDGAKRYTGGDVRVYWSDSPDKALQGPVQAEYRGEGLGEKGVYVAHLDLAQATTFAILAVGSPSGAGGERYGDAIYNGVDRVAGPGIGGKAISVPTPTADNHRGVEPYCTATPPCSMHAISLDVALANGRPTVFNIGTPRFCTSRTCGPVVDVIQAATASLKDRVNLIHAEVWKNDTDAPSDAVNGLSPTAKAWSLDEDPITYWIKPDRTVVGRVVGPVDVTEVRAMTQALLG